MDRPAAPAPQARPRRPRTVSPAALSGAARVAPARAGIDRSGPPHRIDRAGRPRARGDGPLGRTVALADMTVAPALAGMDPRRGGAGRGPRGRPRARGDGPPIGSPPTG